MTIKFNQCPSTHINGPNRTGKPLESPEFRAICIDKHVFVGVGILKILDMFKDHDWFRGCGSIVLDS